MSTAAPEAMLCEIRCQVAAGVKPPADYRRITGGDPKIIEYRGPLRAEYQAVSLVAVALNKNSEAEKGNRQERVHQFYPHPVKFPA